MKNGSLRLRLLLAAAFAITIALFLAGLALATLFEQQVRARVMQELNNDLLQLAGSIEVVPTGEVKVTRPLADPRFETPYGDKYWSIARVPANDSKPLLRSRSFWDSEPALRSVGPEGEPLISVERTITIGSGGKDVSLHLVVSTHAAEIASPLSRFRNQLILYLLLIGMALTIAAWFQVAIGLRPLQTLRDQLPELGGSHTKRLSGEFPNEVQPLVSELNEVLDLRDKSLARARHRAGDLAHGLMTPLTILTAISRQLEEKGLTHYGNEINEQIEKMRGHVERGLVRARLSTGRGYELTPLAENVDAVIATLRKLPKGAEIQWHNNVPSEALVPLERSDLLELLGNLLDNSRKHAHTTVQAGFFNNTITIEDDGPGVKTEDIATIRQRGRRLDESRKGFGLGLGIVEDIADLYELEMSFDRSRLGGLRVQLKIKP